MPSLYHHDGTGWFAYLNGLEITYEDMGQYNYGSLEYPFTLPPETANPQPDGECFVPGIFHEDSFVGNSNISSFYLRNLVPLFNSSTSYYFHLDNTATDEAAAAELDSTLLALLSHRWIC